jgi:uncharacterized protein YgiM (DUF1202 family)
MSKRILSLVAIVTLLVTMFAFMTSASAIYTAYSHCDNGKPLNVRSGPGKNYDIVGKYDYGEAIAIDHDLGNGWSEVVWGSVPAYVMTSLITRTYPGKYDPSKQKSAATTATGLNAIFEKAKFVTPYTVTLQPTRTSKGSANVRWAPSKSATLLKAYGSGTQMTVLAEFGSNWYQVQDPVAGTVGFVNTAYVVK